MKTDLIEIDQRRPNDECQTSLFEQQRRRRRLAIRSLFGCRSPSSSERPCPSTPSWCCSFGACCPDRDERRPPQPGSRSWCGRPARGRANSGRPDRQRIRCNRRRSQPRLLALNPAEQRVAARLVERRRRLRSSVSFSRACCSMMRARCSARPSSISLRQKGAKRRRSGPVLFSVWAGLIIGWAEEWILTSCRLICGILSGRIDLLKRVHGLVCTAPPWA
jgi:hypothetical protein